MGYLPFFIRMMASKQTNKKRVLCQGLTYLEIAWKTLLLIQKGSKSAIHQSWSSTVHYIGNQGLAYSWQKWRTFVKKFTELDLIDSDIWGWGLFKMHHLVSPVSYNESFHKWEIIVLFSISTFNMSEIHLWRTWWISLFCFAYDW